MPTLRRSAVVLLLSLSIPYSLLAQPGTVGLPFLTISPSAEANGMGGIMASVMPTGSSSMLFNPAHAGLLARSTAFSTDIYTSRTGWLPEFQLTDLWINHYSLFAGTTDEHGLAFGIGYSRVYFNLGEFIISSENSPEEISRFRGYETSDNITLGASIDFGALLAFGTTMKLVTSQLTPFGLVQDPATHPAEILAVDLGMTAVVPFVSLAFPDAYAAGFRPFGSATVTLAMQNIGGDVTYTDASQKDPLPRLFRAGFSIDAGTTVDLFRTPLPFLSVTFAREAEDILVKRYNDGSWTYTFLPDDLDAAENLLAGRHTRNVSVRRGASVTLLGTVTLRSGSYDGGGSLTYATEGYTISTAGITSLVHAVMNDAGRESVAGTLLRHVELRIHHSEFSHHDIVGGTSFNSVSLNFHH